ncbi:hypothetical protein SAMN04488057_11883 [Cyclobacterium lianum]|uniref:Uncharacterized protein n=1 Tax=Cyclobacterium lianum TaxID=388280 RepID=A0A1M7QI33_9BACT|nr:hypothetical protein SAMN04488057_11883 [Cyclobacterium lianum]
MDHIRKVLPKVRLNLGERVKSISFEGLNYRSKAISHTVKLLQVGYI